MQFCT